MSHFSDWTWLTFPALMALSVTVCLACDGGRQRWVWTASLDSDRAWAERQSESHMSGNLRDGNTQVETSCECVGAAIHSCP